MSFKDSMLRGLAMVGADAMSRNGYGNAQVLADIVNDNKIGR
ncbi:hypothetical protein [Bifidobacterium platyrrhinorum]|nr:hypothetical protein [Bifidobacterium platyrrhinorum]